MSPSWQALKTLRHRCRHELDYTVTVSVGTNGNVTFTAIARDGRRLGEETYEPTIADYPVRVHTLKAA